MSQTLQGAGARPRVDSCLEPVSHPRSQGFVWHDRQGPFRRLSAAEVEQFDKQGFVVLEDVFDADTIARVIAEIDPVEERIEGFLAGQKDGKFFIARAGEITFTTHLAAMSDALRDFCVGPAFQDIVFDLVGPDVRLYWDQAVYKKPGTQAPFPWHQDNGYTYVEPEQYLTCWVALTDATTENGCPWVVPGVHRGGTLFHEESDLGFVCMRDPGDQAVPAPVRAGGIVVFSSLTPHATGPNLSDETRKSYIVQFAPDGARMFPRDADQKESPDVAPVPVDDPKRNVPVLVGGCPPS